jgi:hypothetical protein
MALRRQAEQAARQGLVNRANELHRQEVAYWESTKAARVKALKDLETARENFQAAGTRVKGAYDSVISNYETLRKEAIALQDGVTKTAKAAADAQTALKSAEDAQNALLAPARALRQQAVQAAKQGLTGKAHQLHLQEVAYLEKTREARAKALQEVERLKPRYKAAAEIAEEAVKVEARVTETARAAGRTGQGIFDAVKGAAGKAGSALSAYGKAFGETKVGKVVKTGGKVLGGLGIVYEGVDALSEIGKSTGLISKGTLQERLDKLENDYGKNWKGNLAWDTATILLSATDPRLAVSKAISATLNKLNAISTASEGFLESQSQVAAAYAQGLDIKRAQFQREMARFRAGDREAQARLARLDREMAELQREINKAKANIQKETASLKEINKARRDLLAVPPEPDFEQPELPDDPGYPTLTKEQRDAISKRAQEKRDNQRAKEFSGSEGDALDGIFAEFDQLESERIKKSELDRQALELAILAEYRREQDRKAWERMKANHPELTDLFGDFIDNNMLDYGGVTGKWLSGTVATDLSPYAEWLLGQDINRLNALARAAGYPNLAAALADSRNLIKKARDTGFRQWAWAPGVGTGAIGAWASEAQHELARAQVLLGDLLNDSRFIDSTAGLSNLAISGTTLSAIFADFGLEDGDIIDITITQLGATLFTQRLTLKNAGTAILTNLRQGVARVEIFAVNEGFASPNTAEISVNNVTAGDSVQQYSLQTGEIAILRVQTGR